MRGRGLRVGCWVRAGGWADAQDEEELGDIGENGGQSGSGIRAEESAASKALGQGEEIPVQAPVAPKPKLKRD